jgi:hypothetical protein
MSGQAVVLQNLTAQFKLENSSTATMHSAQSQVRSMLLEEPESSDYEDKDDFGKY